jgi:hypothetical protein
MIQTNKNSKQNPSYLLGAKIKALQWNQKIVTIQTAKLAENGLNVSI